MLIFEHTRYAHLTETWQGAGANPMAFGQPKCLTAVHLQRGQCMLAGEGRVLATGGVIISSGSLVLEPIGMAELECAVLAGAAPLEIAAQLTAPLLLAREGAAEPALLIHQLVAGVHAENPARQSALCYELTCLLASAPGIAQSLPGLVAAAIGHMQEHYAEVYGIEELAQELGVSKSHLIRTFSAATGFSPGRYLLTVRIEAVKRLLSHRQYPLSVIAGLCGFSGANYLCRVFKKEVGLTPTAWRKANRSASMPSLPKSEWEKSLYL